jgi:methyltransferase
VTLSVLVLAFVTMQRLGELVLARRNTVRLLAQGAIEAGAAHYPLVVAFHSAWLGGLWLLAYDVVPSLPWLIAFLVLQGARLWVLASLGPRWTTRIIVLPGAPLVRHGPYRFLSHPNYAVVAAEIAVLPLAFGLVGYAAVFSVLNGVILAIRIRTENEALAAAGQAPAAAPERHG